MDFKDVNSSEEDIKLDQAEPIAMCPQSGNSRSNMESGTTKQLVKKHLFECSTEAFIKRWSTERS